MMFLKNSCNRDGFWVLIELLTILHLCSGSSEKHIWHELVGDTDVDVEQISSLPSVSSLEFQEQNKTFKLWARSGRKYHGFFSSSIL